MLCCFCLLFLIITEELSAQGYTYHSFPDSNFTWKGYTYFGAQSQSWFDYWTFYKTGDTVINSTTYHQIGNNVFIREDSVKRVYFYANPEKLLYDFSLTVGDTLLSGQTHFNIDSVDTPSYNGILRKTLYSHWHNGALGGKDVWIEGIGSYMGPLGVWSMYTGPGHYAVLCEASENSIVMFQRNDALASNCSYYNSIPETLSYSFSLSPNPATSQLTITTENSSPFDIYLYDITGKCLRTIKNNSSEHFTISVEELPTGYYFLKIADVNLSSTKSFVVAR